MPQQASIAEIPISALLKPSVRLTGVYQRPMPAHLGICSTRPPDASKAAQRWQSPELRPLITNSADLMRALDYDEWVSPSTVINCLLKFDAVWTAFKEHVHLRYGAGGSQASSLFWLQGFVLGQGLYS